MAPPWTHRPPVGAAAVPTITDRSSADVSATVLGEVVHHLVRRLSERHIDGVRQAIPSESLLEWTPDYD